MSSEDYYVGLSPYEFGRFGHASAVSGLPDVTNNMAMAFGVYETFAKLTRGKDQGGLTKAFNPQTLNVVDADMTFRIPVNHNVPRNIKVTVSDEDEIARIERLTQVMGHRVTSDTFRAAAFLYSDAVLDAYNGWEMRSGEDNPMVLMEAVEFGRNSVRFPISKSLQHLTASWT